MGVLKLTLFHAKPVSGAASEIFHKQVERGNAFLKPHGLEYSVYPTAGSLDLEWTEKLVGNGFVGEGLAQRLALRMAANSRYYSNDNRLPVILCQIEGGGGEAPGSIGQKLDWLPWVMIDADTLNNDGLTMTHEAGHCAGLKHPGFSSVSEPRLMEGNQAVTDNIMAYGTFDMQTQKHGARSLIEPWQVDAYRGAYFHSLTP